MAFNKEIEKRLSHTLDEKSLPGLIAKKIFGGVGYMLRGNMACGVLEDQLIVRIGRDGYDDALKKPGVSELHSRDANLKAGIMVAESVIAALNGKVPPNLLNTKEIELQSQQ